DCLRARHAELREHDQVDVHQELDAQIQVLCTQVARLVAIQDLAGDMREPNTDKNTLRMAFLANHRLLPRFFNEHDVKKHESWFDVEYGKTRVLRRRKILRARLTDSGFQEAAQNFDRRMQRRFVRTVLDR